MPVKLFRLIRQGCTSKYNPKLFTGRSTKKQIRRFCRILPDYAEKRSNKDGDIHQRHSKHIWEERPLCQGANAKAPAYVRKGRLAVHFSV